MCDVEPMGHPKHILFWQAKCKSYNPAHKQPLVSIYLATLKIAQTLINQGLHHLETNSIEAACVFIQSSELKVHHNKTDSQRSLSSFTSLLMSLTISSAKKTAHYYRSCMVPAVGS